jgi:hypothetical protein
MPRLWRIVGIVEDDEAKNITGNDSGKTSAVDGPGGDC